MAASGVNEAGYYQRKALEKVTRDLICFLAEFDRESVIEETFLIMLFCAKWKSQTIFCPLLNSIDGSITNSPTLSRGSENY